MFDRLFHKLRTVVFFGVLGLFASGRAWADFPPTTSFPNTGNFQARLVQDRNDIALMELIGNYDRLGADATANVEPRGVLAREFYRTHPDHYDFIVVFSNFEFDTGDAVAFHLGVQNQVKGVGLNSYDNSAYFGSQGKLQGYIDMAALSRYTTNPYDARFDTVLQVFAHEFLHQWAAQVHFKGADGNPSGAMIGKDGAHWSFLLNSGASVEYGNQWRDNANGTFTSVAGRQFYSPLDLYLMGMYSKAEVPPFFLIENKDIDPARLPANDVTIPGTRKDISIDDVLAVEGPRDPDSFHAQKEFRLGFVLLSRPGTAPTDADIAAVNVIRKAIATRMAVLTGGRALMQSYLETKTDAGTPVVTPGGTVRDGAADVNQGLAWLRGRQATDGHWQDNPLTGMRDTAVVFDALAELDGASFTGRQLALSWFGAQTPGNSDYLARQVRAIAGARGNAGAAAQRLLALQNPDGGWGVAARYASNPLDTALAMQALLSFEGTLAQGKLDPAAAYLAAQQNTDGGWGNLSGGASRVAVTATVLQAIKGRAGAAALADRAIAFLATRQHGDGGFGDSPSTVHDTANVMAAMLSYNALGKIRSAQASAYISASQQVDGSWDGSVYATALAVRLLKSAGLFNWTATGLTAQPASPLDGQQAVLTFKVANSGTAPAPAGIARAYDGDPALGGHQIGADLAIPALVAGDSVDLTLLWNTRDLAGVHTIVVIVDPDNAVTEASKTDNRAQLNVTVRAAPVPVELVINAGDITASPLRPNKLPAVIAISALVANIGQTDVANVRVVLRAAGPNGAILDEKIVNLLGRTQQVVNFSATLTHAGAASYTVAIDPDNKVAESDKTNNTADVSVETVPSLDVEVRDADTVIDRNPAYVGADATFTAKIRNAGTQDTPPFKVRYSVTDGNRSVELASRVVQLAAGADSSQDVVWRVDAPGAYLFKVELDPDNLLAETDKTNNAAQLPFAVNDGAGINLSVAYRDFVIDPVQVLEGRPVKLTQTVRNSGTVAATNVEVGFYDGDPAGGHLIGALQTIPVLAPGAAVTVQTTWTSYPDASDHLVFFVADPAARLADVSRDDNAAFIVLTPNSMPDLAVSAGDVQVTPALPTPADSLTVAATVSNLGKQDVANITVRAFDGDPALGGRQLGTDQVIAALPGLSTQTVVFTYPASGVPGTRTLVIVVDPDNRIAEKNEDNNQARRDVLAQSGDFYVSNRYFSPNGDGVKDDTTLGFRLGAASDVTISVVAKNGKVVRTITGDNLQHVTSGAVVWDGLNTRGSVVPDGDYTLRVVNAAGTALGEAVVTLDTNRSSILKAVDTPFALYTNLTCSLSWRPGTPSMFTGDEDKVFLEVRDGADINADGLYALTLDGAETKLLLPRNTLGTSDHAYAASRDGARVAFNDDDGHGNALWVMNTDGTNRRALGAMSAYETAFAVNADGSAVLVVDSERMTRVPTDGSAPVDLYVYDGGAYSPVIVMSPDGKTALVKTSNGEPTRNTFNLVDIASGRVSSLPAALQDMLSRGLGWTNTVWSPDSRMIAMSGYQSQDWNDPATYRIWVFDTQFNQIRVMQYQPQQGTPYQPVSMTAPTWNADSSEFAYEIRYCTSDSGNCSDGNPPAKVRARVALNSDPERADSVLMVANLASGAVEPVESSRMSGDGRAMQFYWVPNARAVVRARAIYTCGMQDGALVPCFDAIDLDNGGAVTPVFKDWLPVDYYGPNPINAQMEIDHFLPASGKLSFGSRRAATDAASTCYAPNEIDQYVFSSLLNLTADLRVVRSATASGLVLRGTAADANFARYTIEYAPTDAPNSWKTVAPSATDPVSDNVFLTWVPPAYGSYRLRLTVEDLAGNTRQVIRQATWTDAPSITDLYKDTEFMSPNGDGAKDGVDVHYHVAEPVHLVFNIYDAQQNLVRTVTRDHYTIGEDAIFHWDGRDDRGRAVLDGQYRITVLDYEFFVTLDTAVPQAAVTLTDAYQPRGDGNGNWLTAFAPRLDWAGADANLASFAIEKGTGDVPSDWTAVYQAPDYQVQGGAVLTAAQFVNQHYRIVVGDKAGNQTVAAAPLGAQQVFLMGYAQHARVVKDNSWKLETPAPYPRASSVSDLPVLAAGASDPLRLRFAETVRNPVAKVLVQYHALADADYGLPAAASDTLAWTDVLVTQFLHGGGGMAEFDQLPKPQDHEIMFAWDMAGIALATDYLVRIKVIDDQGAEFYAAAPYIVNRAVPDSALRIVQIDDHRPDSMSVHAELAADTPAATIELLASSGDDPRFATPRVIHTVTGALGSYDHYLGTDALSAVDLRVCNAYQLTLHATMANGEVKDSDAFNLPPRCMGAEWMVVPDTAPACGVQPAQLLHVQLTPYAGDNRKLTQMLFGRVTADGREDLLNNWNDPVPGQAYAFDIDTAGMPDGVVNYFVRVINEDGKLDTRTITVPVAHAPAVARITYPVEGQKMCGVKMRSVADLSQTVNAVGIEANVTSTSNVTVGLEYAPAGSTRWSTFSPAGVETDAGRAQGLRDDPSRIPPKEQPRLCAYPDAALCRDFHPVQWSSPALATESNYPGQPAQSGTAGYLGLNEQIGGSVSVRLRVFNGAGQQTCSAPVTFDFDNQVNVSPTVPDRLVFSPAAADGPQLVTFAVSPGESVTATLRLYAEADDKHPVRTLADGQQLLAGDSQFTWDGKLDGGSLAADGVYVLVAEYTDSCGNVVVHKTKVEIDTTPPQIHLAAPQPNFQVGLLASVTGTVSDRNFMSYTVEYAVPASPDQWVALASRATASPGDAAEELASWNTLGLAGPATLRVRASDLAGNVTVLTVPVSVVKAGDVLSYLEAVPPLFSPNGDGLRDSVAIRYGLLVRGSVTLDIRRGAADGPVVRTLVPGQLVAAGAQIAGWDGKDDTGALQPDGVYMVHATVSTVDSPVVTQDASFQVILDNTAPQAAIVYPAGDFAPATGSVTVTARDQNLAGYQIYLARDAALSSWQQVGQGVDAAQGAPVFDLATLAEGKYALKLVVQDGAGNATQVVKAFEIDATPPKVALTAPLAGSYLSARQGPAAIAGAITEKNLDSYALRVGQGTPDASWITLASGATLAGPLAQAWDVSQLPDGAYNVVLSAGDRAGQTGSASVAVVVDNTPPRASITAPSGYVRGPVAITGVAFDTNLQSYTIEIAAGTGAAATRWSPLATGTNAIDGGTLLDWQAMPVDGVYTLRLKVLDKAGATTQALAEVTVDTKAPAAPLNLAAKLANRNDAQLTWNASPESDLAGYVVYRNGVRVNTALLTQNSYTDPALANASYDYTVTAIDKAGWESPVSNAVTVAVNASGPSARIVTPARGALVGALVDVRGIASAPTDFKEYRLYIGAGDNPSAWRLLRRSPAPVQMDTLGSWDTVGLPENTVETLKLEAEDIYGVIATDLVTVTVDNTPPPAPTQLTAVANGADVTLHWNASAAPDLAGYVVLRDERIANAAGAVIGSWKPYLVTTTTHVDLQVADGQHRYTVMAMDKAENVSAPSNTATVTIDTRAPHAVLVQPLANAHIGRSTYLLATTPDTDVATVRFQYRPAASADWLDAGTATALPYAATLDGTAFTAGDYQVRAVATDLGGRTDPAPTAIKVTFSDTPDVITDLKAVVNGGDVTLTWSSAAAGLTGYVLERYNATGGVDRINVPVSAPGQAQASYVDSGLPDFRYRYRVSAVGASGTPNMSSDDAIALVHTPQFTVPFTPTAAPVLRLTGRTAIAGRMTLTTDANIAIPARHFDTDADGNFDLLDVAVPMGASSYAMHLVDADGNVSKSAVFAMERGTPPAAPTGLSASVQSGMLSATWNANTEADLLGYRVVRNGMPVTSGLPAWYAEASTAAPGSEAYNAIDGNYDDAWSPDTTVRSAEQTLTVQFQQPSLLTDVEVVWLPGAVAAGYDLQIPAGAGNWATLAAVRGNTDTDRVHPVPQVYVSQLRIKLVDQATPPQLAEMLAFGPTLQSDTSLYDTSWQTPESLQVYAVNGYGMDSAPAQATAGGDTPPGDPGTGELPDLAVDAANLIAESTDYRVGDTVWLSAIVDNLGAGNAYTIGATMTVTNAQGESTVLNDVSFDQIGAGSRDTLYGQWNPAAPGTYTITVTVDAAHAIAETDETNNRASVTMVILPARSGVAIPLTVTAPAQGSALQLNWTAPANASYYRVQVAAAAAGPYDTLTDWQDATEWFDDTAVNGVPRYYIVSAFDEQEHLIGTSAPTPGVAQDTRMPAVPVLQTPTRSGVPITVATARVDIGGIAEPDAKVALVRAGVVVDMATASNAATSTPVYDTGYGRYDLSEDARLLANNGNIVDMATGAARAVPELQDAMALRWSHGAGLLGFVAFDYNMWAYRLHVYSNASQTIVQDSTLQGVQPGMAWAFDDRQLAVVGVAPAGGEGLWIFDSTTGAQRLLVADNYFAFGAGMAWTPDGQHLAFARNGAVEVVKTSDGSTVFAASAASDLPVWSADGKQLLYQVGDGSASYRVGRYTLATDTSELVTDGSTNATQPLWSGTAGDFVTAENQQAILRGADGAVKATLVGWGYTGGQIARTGDLWYTYGSTLTRVAMPGAFTFVKVPLNAGVNLFAARATNDAGNTSALSPAISITLADGMQPDLAAASDDLIVLPAAPLPGETARITAMVRNGGGASAANVTASLALRSPSGVVTTLAQRTTAQLPAGASYSLTADWTPTEAGQYSLVLTLDPNDTVRESNEANNTVTRTVIVASSALPQLNVTLDKAVYGASAPVAASVNLANPGAQIDGTLALRIDDAAGYLVTTLPQTSVILPYGQSAAYPAGWNTGTVLAGDYRFVAELRDAAGALVVAGSAPLRIDATRAVSATVAVEFAQYQQQAAAAIAGTVTLGAGNAGLDGASAQIQVTDSQNQVVFDTAQALGNLLPGTSANVNAVWNTGTTAVGDYHVNLSVKADGATVATATAPVAVVATPPASGTQALSGAMTLSSPTVAVGDRLDVAYTVSNAGAVLAGVPLTVTVTDPDTQAVLALVNSSASLAPGKTQGTAQFAVDAWPLKTLQVTLAADVNGSHVVLQRATLRIIDRTPPVASFALAAQSGTLVAASALPIIVKATDTQSVVTRVEYTFGTSAWTPFALASRADALYGMSLAGIADGPLQIQARAFDAAGNQSEIVTLSLTVDNTAPVIQVAGVVDAGAYADAVTPVVTVTDAHLKTAVMTLDGALYASGTQVSASGTHTLQIDAVDAAGNTSARTVTFRITTGAPPVVALASPAPGALLRTPFTVAATASSAGSTIAEVAVQIDGGAWLPATLAAGQYQASIATLADGRHTLAVRALDATQQVTTLPAIAIEVDNTAPFIAIAGVADGASYTGSATPVIDVSDVHLDQKSVVITLDGAPFVTSTQVTAAGAHTLHVDARDLAGNASTRSVAFRIVGAAPVVALTAPAPGALLRTPLNVTATASSAGSTIAEVAVQIDGGAWLPATLAAGQYQASIATLTDGKHMLAVRAADATQQVTTLPAIAVEVDNTAPVIAITGVADGATYSGSATPVVDVSDAHPDVKQTIMTLDANGSVARLFVSGQPVTAVGAHVLTVSAVDQLGNKAVTTLHFTVTAALSGSLVAAPKPVAIGSPLVLTALVANGGGALDAVQYRVTVTDVASGKVLQQFDDSGALAAGATYQHGFTWLATGTAGATVRATLTATVGTDVRTLGQDTVALAAAPVSLSGLVAVTPKPVEAGAALAIVEKVVNGGSALTGVAVQLTIANQTTGAIVFTHDDTVNLAAGASWSANLGWTASGAAGTGYVARLTATVAGQTFTLGQDTFVVTAPAVRVDSSMTAVEGQRILVLSQCKRAESVGLGTCGLTPIAVDDATTLGRCDTARAQAVSHYLDQIGVPYRVVTTEADFVRELRAGGYSGYWVSGGGTKLHQPTQAELNAGLQLGESLLADGLHDLRGSDRALEELLGVYVSGPDRDTAGKARWSIGPVTLTGNWLRDFLGTYITGAKPGERSGTLHTSGGLYPVNDFDIWGDKLQVDAFENARVEAIIGATAGTDDGHHHDHGFWHFAGDGHGVNHGGEDIHASCNVATNSRTGIVSSTFGTGRTLFFGFDWIASLQAGAANARWLDIGRSSFDYLHAPAVDTDTTLVAGDVVTRRIALHNTGAALAVKVTAQLPAGAKVLGADPANTATTVAGVTTVTWQLNLAADEARDLTLQMKLPAAAGQYDLRYAVSSAAGVALGGGTVTLQVSGVAALAGAVQSAVQVLDVTGANDKARDDVLAWTAKALASSGGDKGTGNDAKALRELVMAQTRLDNISGVPVAAAQQALARMIRALERRQ